MAILGSTTATSLQLLNALPVTSGGTGATTAANARTNLGLGSVCTKTLITSISTTGAGSNDNVPSEAAVITYVASKVASAVQYLGTVGSASAVTGQTTAGYGDFVRVTTQFTINSTTAHVGDIIYLNSTATNAYATASNWVVAHTEADSNTWTVNTVSNNGYVSAPTASNANKVWKTDSDGNPGWRDDADTNTHNSHKVISGLKKDGSTNIESTTASSANITLGDSGATAGVYGDSSDQTPAYAGTFKVPYIRVNAKGIVTEISEHTVKIPASDNTDTHNKHKVISGVKKDGSTNIESATASDGDITLGDSGVTANAYGDSSNQTPGYGSTFKVPYIRVNAKGIVTDISEHTVKIPASDNTDTKNTAGSTDTSSKIFLVGTTSQTTYDQSFSDNEVFVTNGKMNAKSYQIGGTYGPTIVYNTTTNSIDFNF